MSDYRVIEMSDYGAVEMSDYGVVGLSDYWVVGISDDRTMITPKIEISGVRAKRMIKYFGLP
jgi:hypothetical protein